MTNIPNSASSSSNSKTKISILLDPDSVRFFDVLSVRLGIPRSRLITLFLQHFRQNLEQDLDSDFSSISIVDLLGNFKNRGI